MLSASLAVLLAACGGNPDTGAGTGAAAGATQTAAVAAVSSTNLALNKAATASSQDEASRGAGAAVDSSSTTRWSSQYSDAQWISIDLGSVQTFNHVVLQWETAYGKSFQIQTSNNGSTWTTVYSTSGGGGGTNDILFAPVSARYVKMNGLQRGSPWGYSLYQFMVYNDSGSTPPTSPPPSGGRDPLKQPFSSSSIWNTAIGSNAVYVPANLNPNLGGGAGLPQIDDERIVMTPGAPSTAIYQSNAGWSSASRCNATGGVLVNVPMPSNYIVGSNNANSSAAFLAADRRTVIQTQPLARCNAGGVATSLLAFPSVDLYGDGIGGAHGGSGMSALGGSLRIGELRPGGQGPRHALKVNVYGKQALYRCGTLRDCYRWPAPTADQYAVGFYGTDGNNTNSAMKMGALLAIPASQSIANLALETEPARQLAWTLQNYGAYIVDDTWGPNFALNAEHGPAGSFRAQFKADYGLDLEVWGPVTSWARDIQKIMRALHVVNNNSASSIGGGGTPRQPAAPAPSQP
ncbi:MAG: discoidin domain-containing protein [Pseudomonadota bacterium]